ncbi:MAG TPA: hypothetical protein VHH36_05300, partial [Candidatus Thermoplasmatota archaeon]|nr:hypothetical protein [Candidatus Thermoplasmatota archaeon]
STPLGDVGRVGAVVQACALAGLAAAVVSALLGAIKDRGIRLSVLAGAVSAELAALVAALVLVVVVTLRGGVADVLVPASLAVALLLAVAATGAVLLLPQKGGPAPGDARRATEA